MRIAFIDTPSPWLVRPNAQTPLGPLYLATVLEKMGHTTTLARPRQVKDLARFEDWDVVAFTGTTLEYPMVEQCAQWMKRRCPDVSLWYGGPHATALADEIVSGGLFDAVGVGEGELIVGDMADDLEAGNLKPSYQANKFVSDLDEIPFPNRALIEGSHGGAIFSFGEDYRGSGNENVITSRGCPYNCSFCASFNMWHQRVRFRSAPNVAEEIRSIVEKTGCRQIRFADDNFTSNRKRLGLICRLIWDMDLAWRCSVRVRDLTPDVCEEMVAAGCKEVSPGIETGDQRVLDFLDKKANVQQAIDGCRNAMDAGIKVRALFMIGTPGEHPDTPEINLEFLRHLPYHSATLSTFVPMPGSDIWLNPDKYKCQIVTKDFQQYNKDFWVAVNGQKAKREYVPLIRNLMLTEEQQIDNVRRMEEYLLETERVNRG